MVNPFYQHQVLENPKYESSPCHQTEQDKLALKFSKVIHDNCKDATHDIGLILAGYDSFGISFVQRLLRVGFNEGSRIVKKMEEAGLVKKAENGWQFEVIK